MVTSKAEELFKGLIVSYRKDNIKRYGLSYYKHCYLDIERDEEDEKIYLDTFEKIYKKLNDNNKKELEILINYFIEIEKKIERGIKFKVDKIKNSPSDLIVYFSDNLNNKTSNFLPTYEYAVKIVGKDHTVDNGFYCQDAKENTIVSSWNKSRITYGHSILPEDSGDKHYYANINLYRPICKKEKIGISMYISQLLEPCIEERIKRFKKDFISNFIQKSESPIIMDINSILKSGYRQEKKEQEKRENDKTVKRIERKIKSITGKEF